MKFRLAGAVVLLAASIAPPCAGDALVPLYFKSSGYTALGTWSVEATVSPSAWKPGDPLKVAAILYLTEDHIAKLEKAAGSPIEQVVMLITAERTFDAGGILRLSSDEKMSTLISPTGLGIEGGVQGAVTDRFNAYAFQTPVDQLAKVALPARQAGQSQRAIQLTGTQTLPAKLPPGIYRVRLDFGIYSKGRYLSLNCETIAYRPFPKGPANESHVFSQPIRASGNHVSGKFVDGAAIQPRIPWVLLYPYSSNGYQGVVADEDQGNFALSLRNIIPDDVILPMVDSSNRKVSYSLEPQFPTDTIEPRCDIPWDFNKGEISVAITNPDGGVTKLGTFPWLGASGQWPTTKRVEVTRWYPPLYGQYTVKATGWLADVWGNRYEGGGTYHFWIANRMTMATATFQGLAYAVGGKYGRDMAFAPAFPADVQVVATMLPDSDPAKARVLKYSGKANGAGVFTAAQGMQQLSLDVPGEYLAHVLAKYTDRNGVLWVSSMRHAGIVFPTDSPIEAHGKKVQIGTAYFDRAETKTEGWTEPDGTAHLQHIPFPRNQRDVLLIASEGTGANKIEPMLMWDWTTNPMPYDGAYQGIGNTNVQLKTSNGYSPHMFPEYITEWNYFYGAAPRPGFMSRFLVGENGIRAPYWPVSPNSFGGQINASPNGDMPGDIYRLLGGVVMHKVGQKPVYAGYIANAFILPGGSNNNRVVAPGSEDLLSSAGRTGRAFLVGTRPGMMYEAGVSFGPAVQIDPIVPVDLTFTLDYPDGRRVFTSGTGDNTGSWAGQKWILDLPGVYKFNLTGDWNGHRVVMPGLPDTGGELYIVEAGKPAGAPELSFDTAPDTTWNVTTGFNITGRSTASVVRYAAVMPGAVLDQGEIPVTGGKFALFWDPKLMNQRIHTYDIENRVTRAPDIKDVVHLTFFSEEVAPDGKKWHSFARFILRGNRALNTK
jgi:hypothetical protein